MIQAPCKLITVICIDSKGDRNMGMDRIYNDLQYNKIRKTTKEITEEDIFDDDDLDTVTDTEVNIKSIFGEDGEYMEQLSCISELQKENMELKQRILVLEKQLQAFQENIHGSGSILHKEKEKIAPAFREDINLDLLVTLHKQGKTMNQIGRTLGCSPHTVKSRLKKLGILNNN